MLAQRQGSGRASSEEGIYGVLEPGARETSALGVGRTGVNSPPEEGAEAPGTKRHLRAALGTSSERGKKDGAECGTGGH